MADYTLCNDRQCPSREGCFRFKAPRSTWQSVADFGRKKGEEACADFLALAALSKGE